MLERGATLKICKLLSIVPVHINKKFAHTIKRAYFHNRGRAIHQCLFSLISVDWEQLSTIQNLELKLEDFDPKPNVGDLEIHVDITRCRQDVYTPVNIKRDDHSLLTRCATTARASSLIIRII
jgi:hypothetical protein